MSSGYDSTRWRLDSKLALVVGFLSLAGGIYAAHADPATSYEVSIYAGTPLAFWVGVGVALIVAVAVSAFGFERGSATLALVLGGGAATAIVALPVIRNYHFYGQSDSLTHLGWTRAIAAGDLSSFDLIYPGSHTASAIVSAVAGVPITRAMLLLVVAFALIYFLFVPLVLRALTNDRRAVFIGAFSAFMLLPVNNVSLALMYHPFSLTTFFFPVLLYLVFLYMIRSDDTVGRLPSPSGAVLGIASAASVLFHPQVTVNVIIVFLAICGVQYAYRRWRPRHPISSYRALYVPTLFLIVIFLLWNLQDDALWGHMESLTDAVAGFIGNDPAQEPGQIVQDRGESAQGAGTSLLSLFLKLFLVSTVYYILGAALILWKGIGKLDSETSGSDAVTYLALSGIALVPLFAVSFIGKVSGFAFRHVGFLTVLATLLASLALYAFARRFSRIRSRVAAGPVRAAVVAFALVALVLSLSVMFPSPYMYKQTHHVDEQTMAGYRTSFAVQANDVPFSGIRRGPGRYADAFYDSPDPVSVGGIPAENITRDLDGFAGGSDYYLPVTELAREREVDAFRGLRYNESTIDSIGTRSGTHRVYSNGGYTLYYVDGDGDD